MKSYKIFAIVFRFPTGVENMGVALQNLMGGLESIHGGARKYFPKGKYLVNIRTVIHRRK